MLKNEYIYFYIFYIFFFLFRLCTIQDKIEVRTLPEKCGTDFEELRKLDLTTHTLRFEGELALRTDTKKIRVLVS